MRTFALACIPFGLLFVACGDDTSGSGGDPTSSATSVNPTVSSTSSSSSSTSGAGGEGGGGGEAPIDVSLQFQAVAGTDPLACDTTYPGLGAEGGSTEIVDFRFYVHDVRLVRASDDVEVEVELEQDGVWQVENVALLDFEDASGACAGNTAQTRTVITGTVPAGEYDGIKFRIGVPEELNHGDVATAPSPLNLTSLYWSWASGHIHLSAITSSTNGGPANSHTVHLGSTGCMGDPTKGEPVTCSNPNRPEFSFEGFDPATSVITADLAQLVEASNLATEVGCHSFPNNPACAEPFERLGIDYATGELTPETQVFFRVD